MATSLRPPSPVATGPRGAAALGRGAGGAYLASSPPRTLPLCQAYPFSVLSRARDRPWELETKRQLNPRAKERPHFLFPHLWRWQGLGSSWALPVRGCPEREESGVTFSFLEFNFNRAHLTLPTVIFFFLPAGPILFSCLSSFSPPWVWGLRSAVAEPTLVPSAHLGDRGCLYSMAWVWR